MLVPVTDVKLRMPGAVHPRPVELGEERGILHPVGEFEPHVVERALERGIAPIVEHLELAHQPGLIAQMTELPHGGEGRHGDDDQRGSREERVPKRVVE